MKKLTTILLAGVATLAFTACGGGGSPSGGSNPPVKATPMEAVDTETIPEPTVPDVITVVEPTIEETGQEVIPEPTVQVTPIVINVPVVITVEPEPVVAEPIPVVIETPMVIPEPEPITIKPIPAIEELPTTPMVIEPEPIVEEPTPPPMVIEPEPIPIEPEPVIEEPVVVEEPIIIKPKPEPIIEEPVVEEPIVVEEPEPVEPVPTPEPEPEPEPVVIPEPIVVEEFYKMSQIDNDLDVDGVIDITREQTKFDSRGNILSKNYRDKYGDPEAPGSTYTYTYNDRDQVLTYEYDAESDGTKDSYGTYTYDSVGNLISWTRNDYFISYGHMVYDASNNLVERWYFTNDDESHYGYNTFSTYTYVNGNIVTDTEDRFGGNEPNGIDNKWEYDYDTDGNQIYQSWILENGEETVNYSISTYEENHLMSYEHSFGFSTIYTYDNNWNLVLQTNFQDNIQTSQMVRMYDSNNNMLSEVGQNNHETYWTYDENNNMLSRKILWMNRDVETWHTNTYTYENNNMVSDSSDRDSDGVSEFMTRYTYDENDNQLSVSWAKGDEADVHQIEYYTWQTFIK